MSTVKDRNYQTPEAIIRGLLTRFVQDVAPEGGCFCRQCRLLRNAAKLSGFEFYSEPKLPNTTNYITNRAR